MRGVHPEQVVFPRTGRGAEAEVAAAVEGGWEQVGIHEDGVCYWEGH